MGIHIGIEHRTTYRFDRAVQINPQVIRLRPAPHCRTPILAYSLRVTPSEHFVNWQQDPFGNFMARLVFPEPASDARRHGRPHRRPDRGQPVRLLRRGIGQAFPFVYEPQLALDLEPYLRPALPIGPLLEAVVGRQRRAGRRPTPIADFLVGLNQRLYRDIEYSVRMEPGVQAPDETLARGIGSCRDTGWLLVEALRHLGLAARFVSGYLVQLTADQPSLDGADGPAGRLHRPPRLGRGVRPRSRVDRPRPHVGSVRRRRSHPARLHARTRPRPPRSQARPAGPRSLRVLERRTSPPRGPAGHAAVHRRAVGGHRRTRRRVD